MCNDADMTEHDEYLRPTEAAQRLGVNLKTLSRWADAGHIACRVRPSGHRQYPAREVERVLAEMEEGGR